MNTDQIPEVVRLNVGGTHKFTTLRSTLTKEKGSILAQMFTGQLPVYKDDNGCYFLDGDGLTFQVILDWLKYDSFQVVNQSYNHGFGFGGVGLFARTNDYRADGWKIYQNAVKLGLDRLARHLEQQSPVVFEKKLKEFRSLKPGYEDCLAQVLAAIPPESLLLKDHVSVRIQEEAHSVEDTCCEHSCQQMNFQLHFGSSVSLDEVDATVTVQFDIDSALLAILCYDLLALGYTVKGRETNCGFLCDKNKPSSGFVIKNDMYCCRQRLYLLNFSLHGALANQPGFVQNNNGGLFGTPATKPAFTFSGPPANKQSSLFGSSNSGCFGSQLAQTSGFGSSSFGASNSFGASSQQHQSSGSSLGGFGFGAPASQQQQQQQQQQQSSGFGFGSSSNAQSQGFGSPVQQQQQSSGFGFGASSNAQSQGFGAPVQQQQQTSLFGSTGGGTGLFGQATPRNITPPPHGGGLFGGSAPDSKSPFAPKSQDKSSPKPAGFGGFGSSKLSPGHVFGGPPTFPSPAGSAGSAKGGVFGSLCSSDEEKTDVQKVPSKTKSSCQTSFTFGIKK